MTIVVAIVATGSLLAVSRMERAEDGRQYSAERPHRPAACATPTHAVRHARGQLVHRADVPVSSVGLAGRIAFTEPDQVHQPADERVVATCVMAGGAAAVITGLLGRIVRGKALAPLRTIRHAAEHVTGTDLTPRVATSGSDDVAQLGRAFNDMLDRLQQASDEQLQLIDDAGHELRTPITVVRGHMELLAMTDPGTTATCQLVIDELDRMSRLVGDLSLLASSQRPSFLSLGPVDVADLTIGALRKAQGLGDRTWTLDEFTQVQTVADEQRLTEALMQLLANAVAHTREGDPIAIGSALRAGSDGTGAPAEVALWVRDKGAGIGEGDAGNLFVRHFRADTSQASRPGSGLGLPIVAKIARAHGGRVTVQTEPGRGATFTLVIPLRPPVSDTDGAGSGQVAADPCEGPGPTERHTA